MPFNDVITILHHREKISMNELSKRCGITRQCLIGIAKSRGLKIRSVKEATRLTKNKGEKHWCFGKKFPEQSKKMKENNPAFSNDVLSKRAETVSNTYRKNPLPQEIEFMQILDNLGVEYLFQFPIDRYVIDFFIPSKNVLIEIDSTRKWGRDRRNAAARRDKKLMSLGYNTVRICKSKLKDELFIYNVLYTNNIITDL